MGCHPAACPMPHAATASALEGHRAVLFCCSSLRPRTHLNVCCSCTLAHGYTNFTYTSQNSNFKGRAEEKMRQKPRPLTKVKGRKEYASSASSAYPVLFFSVWFFGGLLSFPMSCVLSHVHVLFASQHFVGSVFVFFFRGGAGWRNSASNKPKNVRRTTASTAKRGVNNWALPSESIGIGIGRAFGFTAGPSVVVGAEGATGPGVSEAAKSWLNLSIHLLRFPYLSSCIPSGCNFVHLHLLFHSSFETG